MKDARLICTDVQAAHIPGTRYDFENQRIVGPPDGIAVAAYRLGLKVPIPPAYPKLDSGGLLRKYQDDGVSWLVHQLGNGGGALLADDMGLGKTAQSIHAWLAMDMPLLLVVCPGSVRETWRRQLEKWAGVRPMLITAGKQWQTTEAMHAPVLVTSYELSKQIPDWLYPRMLIVDEIHNYRGRQAQRSVFLRKEAQAIPYKIGLSGTPMWSHPKDMYMTLRLLYGSRVGNADDFDFAYCGAHYARWGNKNNEGVSRADELKLRMQWLMKRRLKRDVAKELPPVTREIRWVDGTKRAAEKLRQAMLSIGGTKTHDALEATLDDKIDVVVEAAVDFGSPVVVYTWMKTHARLLQLRMQESGIDTMLIDGDVPHKQRDLIIAKAAEVNKNRGDARGMSLVCTIDSVKEGVDGLQFVASNCIFHSLDYVPIKTAQTISRHDRMGQTEPVTALFVAMKNSMDELVANTVIRKLDQWTKIFGVDDTSKMKGVFVKEADEEEMSKVVLAQMYQEFSAS